MKRLLKPVSWMEAKNLEIQVRCTGMGAPRGDRSFLVMCGEVREGGYGSIRTTVQL